MPGLLNSDRSHRGRIWKAGSILSPAHPETYPSIDFGHTALRPDFTGSHCPIPLGFGIKLAFQRFGKRRAERPVSAGRGLWGCLGLFSDI